MSALLAGYAASPASSRLERCRRLCLLRLACIHREAELVGRAGAPGPPPGMATIRATAWTESLI